MILVLQYASGSTIGMHCHNQSLRFVRIDTCCFALVLMHIGRFNMLTAHVSICRYCLIQYGNFFRQVYRSFFCMFALSSSTFYKRLERR